MRHANPILLLTLLLTFLAVPFGRAQGQSSTPPKPLIPDVKPVRTCESLTSVSLPNTSIGAAVAYPGDDDVPASCLVTAMVTHPPAGDQIRVIIWLPVENWNGRFQGTGGGGFSGGSERNMPGPLSEGFVVGSTNTGHEGGSGSFALDDEGRLNWMLIRDNAYLGIHAMTVTGKSLTEAFYGVGPRYSYFTGCSTGGRQGLMEAQRYPADYDGILSGCPAINWSQLHGGQMWGHLVMLEAENFVPQCKFEAARVASIEACDETDGVLDGVIENPRQCTYDPRPLIGASIDDCEPISDTDADVIRKIWQGPRRQDGSFLWYGLPYGADFSGLTRTGGDPVTGQPFPINLDWIRFFLTQDPEWDWTTITPGSYEQLWDQGMEQYTAVLGTDNPDLSGFRDRGGKAILWHGWVDQLIYPEGTIDYYNRVRERMGGAEKTAEFLRLFMAPGVAHCRGGDGPQPSGHFEALRKWVEEGEAPETLDAILRDESENVIRTRPLCQFPLVANYKGSGSTDDASNFECVTGF